MMKKVFFSFIFLSISILVLGQDSLVAKADRQATGLRAEGKIYVVLAVVLTILVGLFVYLIRLDKKISRLEKGR
jgi:hypothetical protein